MGDGIFCAGNIADVLYGASLVPNLQQLFLANQSFSGSLPASNMAMAALEEMDLSNNHIEARQHFLSLAVDLPLERLLSYRRRDAEQNKISFHASFATRFCLPQSCV